MAENTIIEPIEHTDQETTDIEPEETPSEEPKDQKTTDKKPKSGNKFARLWQAYLAKKKLTIPVTVVVLVGILLAVPLTRYPLLGTFMSKNFSVVVDDSQTGKPVSSATVTAGSKTAKTDASGKATLKLNVGNRQLTIQKKYYKDFSTKILVPLGGVHNPVQLKVEATGRQVPIVIKNKITNQPLSNAVVSAAGTEAKTDKDGKVTIVLPADKATVDAIITDSGYNDTKASITVTDKEVDANSFSITPAGKLYFLSKLSGKIDVVKTDLDGANRQTVLAGTGNEDDQGTVLLATRDWKFLALDSIRTAGGQPEINLIDTSNDQVTNIDKGDAVFTVTGWLDHNFIYTVSRNAIQVWQPKKVALKSFNADAKKLNTIDETDATGDQSAYASEDIPWVAELSDRIVYFKTWSANHTNYSVSFPEISGKQAQLIGVAFDSNNINKSTIKSFDLSAQDTTGGNYYGPLTSYDHALYQPNNLYFDLYDNQGVATYDKYASGQLSENDQGAESFFNSNKPYPTFLASPSGKQTLWSESRDGKNVIFVGNANGDEASASSTNFAGNDSYDTYGWYSDNYALLSKNGSELYIVGVPMTQTFPSTGVQILKPFKITDYHKPALRYDGYGGGYGGN